MGTYLSVLAHHHQDTYLHTLRVSALCIDIGLENELDPPLLIHLGYAGLLHDIGKALVPKELLTKTTQLSSLEQHMMREHVRLGFRILEEFKPEIVKEIVVGHHEFSNSPYPRDGFDRRFALRRSNQRRDQHENIGQAVQILAVADIFDALIQPRAYKKAFQKEYAESVLRHEFTGDPALIDQVLHRLNETKDLSNVIHPPTTHRSD